MATAAMHVLNCRGPALTPGRHTSSGRRSPGIKCLAKSEYDYIIVGGGLAGCLLANRLSAEPSKRVLVLEAGPVKSDRLVSVPAGITKLFQSSLDWNLWSSKQPQLEGRELYVARGKIIGGSSCTNATLYHRGAAEDYDSWGVPGWTSEDVLPWFKHAEKNSRGKSEFHGAGGLMNVEDPRYRNQLFDKFFRAAEEAGLSYNPDFNDWSHSQEGFGDFQVSQRKGVRADAFSAMLKPVMGRTNLDVEGDAFTTKVCFEEGASSTKAVGIEYVIGGKEGTKQTASVAANGEVILCAGAIHSPSILLHSGVGPEDELLKFGIPLVKKIDGVGKNLQDHPACLSAYKLKPEYERLAVTNHVYNDQGQIRKRALLNYALFRRGPLTTTGCDRGAFVSSSGSGLPDVQMRFPPGYALDPDGISSYVKFGEMKRDGVKWPGGITFQIIACRPESKGCVGLQSNDPFEDPKIDIGYLSDKSGKDLAALRYGLRFSRKMASSKAWAPYLAEEGFPGKNRNSDEELDTYIKDTVHSANALVGSCCMGNSEADGSVVDANLKVHGIDGLRVVDASVIPVIPGGQTGAPVVMIGEKVASLITS